MRYTLWDPNKGNVKFNTATFAALAAGAGITLTQDATTGVITIVSDDTTEFASPPPLGSTAPNTGAFTTLAASSNSALSTAQFAGLATMQAGLAVTGNAVLGTTQVGGLTAATLALSAAGTFVVNGAALVTTNFAGITANSVVIPTLKTVGGTPGAIPAVVLVNPGVSFVTKATASDTSTYNFAVIN